MNALVVFWLVVVMALSAARPGNMVTTGLGVHTTPLALAAGSLLASAASSQVHGYSGGPSTTEKIITGSRGYTYVDYNGIRRQAQSISDPINSFPHPYY